MYYCVINLIPEGFYRFRAESQNSVKMSQAELQKSIRQQKEMKQTMKEWGDIMHVEKEVNAESGSVVKCEEAEAMLKRTVSLQQIINEGAKRVEEFQKLGASQRRVVTNLVNEMRLRLHFLGTPFDN